MASTVTRSPPTSRAIAARSSVLVMTFNLLSACVTDVATAITMAATQVNDFVNLIRTPQASNASARVRTVGADRELELKKKLICRIADRVVGTPVLAADLTEFARPERQQ